MLDEVYPHLRCARYLAVYYDSSDDKAVDVINQANQLLRDGQYEEALELAMTVSDDFRAYNTIAAAKMMTLDFEGMIKIPARENPPARNRPSPQLRQRVLTNGSVKRCIQTIKTI